MKKYCKIFIALLKQKLYSNTTYKLGFWGPFFIDASLYIVQLILFKTIYLNVESVGTWSMEQMTLYIGTFSLIDAINMTFFFFGINQLPQKIFTGDMDIYLSQPVNPLFRITFEKINLGSIPLIAFSCLIIAWGAKNVEINIESIAKYLILLIFMIVLYYDLQVIVRSTAFFWISISGVLKLEAECIKLCMQLPGNVYKGLYKIIFCFIIPYGILATMPVQGVFEERGCLCFVYALIITIVFTYFMIWIWKKGIKRYNGVNV